MLLIAARQRPYLSQTREQYVDSQSPDGCRLHKIVLTVGEPQQHGDAHQLGFVLQVESHMKHTGPVKLDIPCLDREVN